MKVFYNIHNLLKVKISGDCPDLVAGYDDYLRNFRANVSEESDYEIKKYRDFKLPNDYKNGTGFIFFKNGVCFPNEKYALIFDGGKIIEYTNYANRATNLLLQILFVNKGLSFIHGAGFVLNSKGLIFPAAGGVGKTLLISEMRKQKEFQFFGDDYVIVDKNGLMYSYPSDFSIYQYHLSVFPELRHTSFSRYLWRRKIFSSYYFIKRAINFLVKKTFFLGGPLFKGPSAEYAKVPVSYIIPENQIGTKSKISASIFLERHNDNGEDIGLEKISPEILTKKIIGVLNREFRYALPYLYALSAAGIFDFTEFQNKQEEIIKNAFSGAKLYRVRISQNAAVGDYLGYMNKCLNLIIQ